MIMIVLTPEDKNVQELLGLVSRDDLSPHNGYQIKCSVPNKTYIR